MSHRTCLRSGLAFSVLAVLGVTLASFAALFAQTGPNPEAPLPAPRRLPAGAPVEEPLVKPQPTAAPVEEPAPPPHEVIGPLGSLPPAPTSEEAAPMPRQQTPSPPPLVLPSAARAFVPEELQRLHQEIEALRAESEAMLLEEMDLMTPKEVKSGKADENAEIRRRITALLLRAAQRDKDNGERGRASAPSAGEQGRANTSSTIGERDRVAAPKAPHKAQTQPRSPDKTSAPPLKPNKSQPPKHPDNSSQILTDAPVDPLSLAQSLFSAGDHAAALEAYRRLEHDEQKPDERITIQYMIACCLRKLGKLDEAAMLYREVASSGGSDILVENAQWYLRAMKDRRQLDAQLDELRQGRLALTPRKP